jgi:hypothetical protein
MSIRLLEEGTGNCEIAFEVPANLGNTRFLSDYFDEVNHPSLSLNGFSCAESGTNCDNGLGLKEVLEKLTNETNKEEPLTKVLTRIVDVATEEPYTYDGAPSSKGAVKGNTRILQAQAFVALVTYVLEQNGVDTERDDLGLPTNFNTHAEVMDSLRTNLLNTPSWQPRIVY